MVINKIHIFTLLVSFVAFVHSLYINCNKSLFIRLFFDIIVPIYRSEYIEKGGFMTHYLHLILKF